MKKPDREDIVFLLIGLLLLAGMLLTFLWGGNRSRHGVGMLPGIGTVFGPDTDKPSSGDEDRLASLFEDGSVSQEGAYRDGRPGRAKRKNSP